MKPLLIILIVILSGCAITDEERYERLEYMANIESEYQIFVSDCNVSDGKLFINLPLEKRRVQNAPVTVWEMKYAECWYDDIFPIRMR